MSYIFNNEQGILYSYQGIQTRPLCDCNCLLSWTMYMGSYIVTRGSRKTRMWLASVCYGVQGILYSYYQWIQKRQPMWLQLYCVFNCVQGILYSYQGIQERPPMWLQLYSVFNNVQGILYSYQVIQKDPNVNVIVFCFLLCKWDLFL